MPAPRSPGGPGSVLDSVLRAPLARLPRKGAASPPRPRPHLMFFPFPGCHPIITPTRSLQLHFVDDKHFCFIVRGELRTGKPDEPSPRGMMTKSAARTQGDSSGTPRSPGACSARDTQPPLLGDSVLSKGKNTEFLFFKCCVKKKRRHANNQ